MTIVNDLMKEIVTKDDLALFLIEKEKFNEAEQEYLISILWPLDKVKLQNQ